MQFNPYDSSGTDDDLPPQRRGLVGAHSSGNGRVMMTAAHHSVRGHNDMDNEIHLLEKEAYSSVLRAFKAQSDAITWEKESLITNLRKELRVSDEEHRELLNEVNADKRLGRIRELRQVHVPHPSSQMYNDPEPSPSITTSRKRPKMLQLVPSSSVGVPSPGMRSQSMLSSRHSLPPSGPLSASMKESMPMTLTPTSISNKAPALSRNFSGSLAAAETVKGPLSIIGRKIRTRWPEDNNFYEAVIAKYNPDEGLHALVYDIGTSKEAWEWINLKEIAPEDIRWEGDDPDIANQDGWGAPPGHVHTSKVAPGSNGTAAPGTGLVRGRFQGSNSSKSLLPPLQNGSGRKTFSDIEVPNTASVVKEVEKALAHVDLVEIEKAKKLLKDHELLLLDAIAKLTEASDDEAEAQYSQGVGAAAAASAGGDQGWK